MTGYARDQFGAGWVDVDRNGCDTRNDILRRDLTGDDVKPGTHDCVVLTGMLADPYTGRTIAFRRGAGTSTAVQIDHVVALSRRVADRRAAAGRRRQRTAFANDPLNLLAVDGPTNEQKGDGDAATWLPPNKAFRCTYVAHQVGGEGGLRPLGDAGGEGRDRRRPRHLPDDDAAGRRRGGAPAARRRGAGRPPARRRPRGRRRRLPAPRRHPGRRPRRGPPPRRPRPRAPQGRRLRPRSASARPRAPPASRRRAPPWRASLRHGQPARWRAPADPRAGSAHAAPGTPLEKLGFLTIGLFDAADPGRGSRVDARRSSSSASSSGFDSAWVRHRHLQYGISSPVAVLAAASQRTRRIELGTAVIPLGWENPLRLAEDLATVDILSGGRLNPGVSVGPPMHWDDVKAALYPDTADVEDFSYERVQRLLRLRPRRAGHQLQRHARASRCSPTGSSRTRPGCGARIWYGGAQPAVGAVGRRARA